LRIVLLRILAVILRVVLLVCCHVGLTSLVARLKLLAPIKLSYLIFVLGLRPTGIAILGLGHLTTLGLLSIVGSNKGTSNMRIALTHTAD
jgi:hypothetical protein